jgi:hypothetical protein
VASKPTSKLPVSSIQQQFPKSTTSFSTSRATNNEFGPRFIP